MTNRTYRRGWFLLLVVSLAVTVSGALVIGCVSKVKSTFRDEAVSTAGLFSNNTLVKRYLVMPGEEPPVDRFEGYEITAHIQAVEPQNIEGIDSFRVAIETQYLSGVGNTEEAGGLPMLAIDSVAIRLSKTDSTLWPALAVTDYEQLLAAPALRQGRLVGPTYRYELIEITDEHRIVEFVYLARLIDRVSGRELNRLAIPHALRRVHEMKYYRPQPD